MEPSVIENPSSGPEPLKLTELPKRLSGNGMLPPKKLSIPPLWAPLNVFPTATPSSASPRLEGLWRSTQRTRCAGSMSAHTLRCILKRMRLVSILLSRMRYSEHTNMLLRRSLG